MGRMIPVFWVDAHPLCWDQAMIDDVLNNRRWDTGYTFEHRTGIDGTLGGPFAVVVIPARYHADNVPAINKAIGRYDAVLVILTSDEERRFPVDQLTHPRMRVWVQTPGPHDTPDYPLPVGYPPHAAEHLSRHPHRDRLGWFFAGQINHARRKQCATQLRRNPTDGAFLATPGFTQGFEHADYFDALATSRVIPCPSGPHTVDTFRVWEALEAGCIPVVDGQTPDGDAAWYWSLVANELGLPVITEWTDFPQLYTALNDAWPSRANDLQGRWQHYKRRLAERTSDTIRDLTGAPPNLGPITVLVPTSPIAAHPDTTIIETTIASVRHHLPDAEIIVMCDGVRPEQIGYRQRYDEYLERLTWLTAHQWNRVLPVLAPEHLHQAEMTRRALAYVRTPLVLFVEHDAPLVTDEPIDFRALTAACLADRADLIRLHHEAHVLPDHQHMMLDNAPQNVEGAPLLRTVQWSQRPHLATTAFYRRALAENFPEGHRGMIEDVMHGVCHNAWREHGLAGWDRHRLWLYAPPGGNIKRSYTLDGRGTDPKWVDS